MTHTTLRTRLTRRKLLAGALALPLVAGGSAGLLAMTHRLPGPALARDVPLPGLPAPAAGPSDRLVIGDQAVFGAGVNYPWKTGQDFGTGGWGHSGVSDPTTYQEVDIDFANMAAQGVRLVKWRVFSDGRYSPEFADDGSVTGLDDAFFADVDAALEIAAKHDVYLVFTLFSSGFWTADCSSGGVRMGGHAATLLDPDKRRSLVDNALAPFLQHIAGSDRVVAFEVIAEPEWGVQELYQDQDGRLKLPHAVVRDFVGECVRAIHRHTHALATVEANRFSNMQAWQGLGLDYYSFSWYDWVEPYEPLATPAAAAGLDRPIVLGEYPAGGSAYHSLSEVLALVSGSGYAGAFAWSYWGGDGLSHWRQVAPEFTAWVRQRWDAVNLGRVAPPSEGPIAEQPYPYTYRDLAVRLDGDAIVAEMKIDVASGEAYVPHAYLYAGGNTQPLEDVRLSAAPGQPGRLAARFTQFEEAKPYSISVGIFSRTDALRKWFGDIATLAVQDGVLTTPKVDTLANELGCSV